MNDDVREIRGIGLRLLTVREHSKKELLQKLAAKGFGNDVALPVIEQLSIEGWQDDLRYAENYARSRIMKGYGPVRIAYELRRNGVDIETSGMCGTNGPETPAASVNLDDLAEAEAGGWAALLERIYCKKYGLTQHLDINEWAKRSRFLMQRGFTAAMISALFEHLNIKVI